MATCGHGVELGQKCEKCIEYFRSPKFPTSDEGRQKYLATVHNLDAPEGLAWICHTAGCKSWATLGGNAAYHARKLNHSVPSLAPQPKGEEDETEPGPGPGYRLLLVEPDGRQHEIVHSLTGDSDDTYLERILDDGSTEMVGPC